DDPGRCARRSGRRQVGLDLGRDGALARSPRPPPRQSPLAPARSGWGKAVDGRVCRHPAGDAVVVSGMENRAGGSVQDDRGEWFFRWVGRAKVAAGTATLALPDAVRCLAFGVLEGTINSGDVYQ